MGAFFCCSLFVCVGVLNYMPHLLLFSPLDLDFFPHLFLLFPTFISPLPHTTPCSLSGTSFPLSPLPPLLLSCTHPQHAKSCSRQAAASGLYYPLSLEPKSARRGAESSSPTPPPASAATTPTTNGAAATSSSPSGAGLTINTDNAADGAATTAAAIPTGSAAAAAARARASRVAAASEVTEATARRYGGLRQKQAQ